MEDRDSTLIPLIERPRPTIFAATAMLLLAAAGLWIASLLTAGLNPGDGAQWEFLFDLIYYVPFVALPIAVYGLRRRGLSASLRLNPMPVAPVLAVITAAVLSVYLASAADGLWTLLLDRLGLHAPQTGVTVPTSRALMLAILHTAAIPAIFEELLCRGVVFAAFESRGTRRALWISSALFALLHGNAYGLPAYFLVGAVSAFLVYALDSLYAGIIYHTVYNTVILATLYALPQAGETTSPQASMLLSVAIDAIFMALLLGLLLRSLDLRRRRAGITPVPRIRQPLRRGERALLILLAAVLIGTCALVLAGV